MDPDILASCIALEQGEPRPSGASAHEWRTTRLRLQSLLPGESPARAAPRHPVAGVRRAPEEVRRRLHEPRNWQREARAERQRSRLEAACQRAAESERERILRDLHDGCGGQLVTALRLTQGGAAPERIAAALQDCVDDLRITLEALTPTADDLLPLLAGFRNRSELRLDQHDIKLHWSCPDLPDLAGLAMGDCGQPLHVLRILQEALTNVIKHSGAQTVEVSLQIAATVPRALLILLRDDGHGMQPGRPGRGLANMARRAELIGAELELASTAGGTCLTLRVPLAPA